MKDLAPRIVLACLLILMPTVATFGQQTANPEANVQNARTYHERGLARQKKGDLNGALIEYNQAIKLNPKNATAYKDRGNAKRKQGDLQGAKADFNQASKLGSRSGDVAETPD